MNANQILSVVFTAAAIALGVSVFLAPRLELTERPRTEITTQRAVPADPPKFEEPQSFAAAILKREENGHYWAQADVGGTAVKFLIDTGASTVALTYRDAQRLGLQPETLDYSWSISTAGGETFGASVLLPSIRIGQVEVPRVEAMVLRDGLEQSLLGMTFLRELYSYEFRGDRLIIRQ